MTYIRPIEVEDLKNYLMGISKSKSVFQITTFNKLFESYLDYLKKTNKTWFPKNTQYKDNHIGESIFILEFPKGNKLEWVKYNLFALIKSSIRIKSNIINYHNISQNVSSLKTELSFLETIVWDALYFHQFAHTYITRTSTKISLYVRKDIDSMESYKASYMLLRQNIMRNVVGDYVIRPLSVFLIRQAIELRLKNSLGVKIIVDKTGKIQPISAEYFLNIYKHLNKYFPDKIVFPIEFSILEKILRWSQYFVHAGFIPYFWQIEWAQYLLNPLFTWGAHGRMNSAYGSIKIDKSLYEKIDKILIDQLRTKKYSKLKKITKILFRREKNSNFSIERLSNPESIIM